MNTDQIGTKMQKILDTAAHDGSLRTEAGTNVVLMKAVALLLDASMHDLIDELRRLRTVHSFEYNRGIDDAITRVDIGNIFIQDLARNLS